MIRLLPLFPLPVVLFPGAAMPLHIFEPRYRRLLADALAADRRFGLVYRPERVAERELAPGHVGCVAVIERDQVLPDGASNIVVRGEARFALERFVATPAPYLVAEVSSYDDEPEAEAELVALAARVRELFERVGRASRALADDTDPLPEMPTDAAEMSFVLAASIDFEGPDRQRLLSSRSAAERLRQLADALEPVAEPMERRATVHARAKLNGQGRG